MAPPNKKRKTRAAVSMEIADKPQPEDEAPPAETVALEEHIEASAQPAEAVETEPASLPGDAALKAKARQERFKALQARAKTSAQTNMKEAALESARLATDPNILTALNRKQAVASHNLMKADTEAAGEDFERKRAWDWTIDESEKWDKRMAKIQGHEDDQAFQDYRQASRKVYKRQMRTLKPDMEQYAKEKLAAVEKAAAAGELEIVETEDGELIAVDKDGTFYASAESTSFVDNKPDKAAIDRLVADLHKAEEVRLKKRRARGQAGEDGDVTYINDKNKQFNEKLNRFYGKYTAEIKESFERGTMI